MGAKVSLANPDGSGLSIAAAPFVSVPVGGSTFGADGWGAGMLVPVTYALPGNVSLQLTPQVDIVLDGDGSGRHLAANAIAGVGVGVAEGVSLTGELSAGRDYDPDGGTTQTFAALAAAYAPRHGLQFDTGAVFGLNSNSPDARLYAGIAILF